MRTLFRLTVLALAAYGAKTLYDQYGASLSGQAHHYEPPGDVDDGDVGQVYEHHDHEATRWSVGDATDAR